MSDFGSIFDDLSDDLSNVGDSVDGFFDQMKSSLGPTGSDLLAKASTTAGKMAFGSGAQGSTAAQLASKLPSATSGSSMNGTAMQKSMMSNNSSSSNDPDPSVDPKAYEMQWQQRLSNFYNSNS